MLSPNFFFLLKGEAFEGMLGGWGRRGQLTSCLQPDRQFHKEIPGDTWCSLLYLPLPHSTKKVLPAGEHEQVHWELRPPRRWGCQRYTKRSEDGQESPAGFFYGPWLFFRGGNCPGLISKPLLFSAANSKQIWAQMKFFCFLFCFVFW